MKKNHLYGREKPYINRLLTVLNLFLVMLSVNLPGYSQTNEIQPPPNHLITGIVTDEKGEPLPGVTVKLFGTIIGVATDIDGKFIMRVPAKEGKLLFSYIGLKNKEFSFITGEPLQVVMEDDINQLDEIQVVAYGTQNKREIVGAMSTVKAAEIADIPSPAIGNLLQGRVAGMTVVNTTGAPGGSGNTIMIRGFNSLSMESGRRGSEPLWVIDGVPMHSFTSDVTEMSSIADIDPKDIENIQILKDAASASIYGSRAANGVILVTTKKGNFNQKSNIEVNISRTHTFRPEFPKQTGGNRERQHRIEALNNYMTTFYDPETNSYRYPESYKEAFFNSAQYNFWFNSGLGARVPILQDSLNPYYNNSTNLFKYYFKPASVTDANIQISGGAERINYNVGLGYYNEKGSLRNTGFNRIKLMSNLGIKPFDKMLGNIRFYISRSEKDRAGKGFDLFNFTTTDVLETIPAEILNTSSLLPGPGTEAFDELVQQFNKTKEKNEAYRLRTSVDLSYEVLNGLMLKSSFAVDFSQQQQNLFRPAELDQYNETYSSADVTRNLMWLNENIISYKQTFKDAHTVDILGGISFQADETNSIGGYGKRSPSDLIHYVPWPGNAYDGEAGRQLKEFNTDFLKSTMVGIFGRINYNYKEKYLASVTLRRDGSSKFGENTRWGTFPAFALGYAFSEENYMDFAKDWLNYAKLRLSYGKSGNQFENPYLAHGTLLPGNTFLGNPSITPEWFYGMMNKKLTWEETDQYDFGLDVDMCDYRIGVTFDYYYRYTDKLLFPVSLSGNYNGFHSQWRNAYAISNQGIELQINADIIRRNDLKWKFSFNIARNWNKLEKSNNDVDYFNAENQNNISVIGKPLNGIYAYKNKGFYNSPDDIPYTYINGIRQPLGNGNQIYLPGDRIIYDADGNGKINVLYPLQDDRIYCGSPLPLASGGIINDIKWKNFDVSILFNYVLGRHILNAGKGASIGTYITVNPNDIARPIYDDLGNISFWEKPGDNPDYPANRVEAGLSNFATNLSSNVEKVNYIKLKSLTVGYTIPKHIVKCGLRFYVSGENLFTITNYSGNDPETVDVVTGIDNYNLYPISRKITFGLTAKF